MKRLKCVTFDSPPPEVLFPFEYSNNWYQIFGSHKEKPNSLEKRSEDGSLQNWEDHRQSSNWCAPHSTQVKPNSLEKRSEDGSLQNWEDHRQSSNWCAPHSTQVGGS